jgi:alkylation response protein AidB-like acyl-CoA dehydrogenase
MMRKFVFFYNSAAGPPPDEWSAVDYDLGESAEDLRSLLRTLVAEHLPESFLGALTDNPADLELTNRFCRILAEEGLLCAAWPREYGGRDGSVWEQTVVREEMWAAYEPRGPQYMGVNWIGPAVMRHGSEEQKAFFLPMIARGETIWCQGFSEPEAGSDLANLRTRATPDGDGWSVRGQKVWTSYADLAEWIVLATITNPEASAAHRFTLFLVPMGRAGIEVRPIEAMVGPHHLNEVFIDGLHVAPSDVLGEVDGGWRVMRDALAHERVGIARYARGQSLLDRLMVALGDDWGALPDSVKARWVRALIDLRTAQLLAFAAVAREDGVDSSEAAVARIVATTCDQVVAEVLFDAIGTAALDPGADALVHGGIEDHWRYAQASTVASGTIEVQRMILARRLLGGQ